MTIFKKLKFLKKEKESTFIKNVDKYKTFDHELSAHYEACVLEYVNKQVDRYINIIKENASIVEERILKLSDDGSSHEELAFQFGKEIESLQIDDEELKRRVSKLCLESIFRKGLPISEIEKMKLIVMNETKKLLEIKVKNQILRLIKEMVSDSSGKEDKYEENIEKILHINKAFKYEINNKRFLHCNSEYEYHGTPHLFTIDGKKIYNPNDNFKISVSTNQNKISDSSSLEVTNTILVDRANIIDIQALAKCVCTETSTGTHLQEGEIFLLVDDILEYDIIEPI